jgi:carboxymethylenebutenolidase
MAEEPEALVTRMIELETADGLMPCYEAVPTGGGSRCAVIVIQEAFGVNGHIQELTRRFAGEGYHAVAPALFHRTGDNPIIPYDRFDEVMKHMTALSDEGILADVDAVREHLSTGGIGDGHTGAIGFCMGGRASFLVAARRPLGAAVSFYGGGIVTARSLRMPALLREVAQIETPWLGLFGDMDESIPVDDVEELRSTFAEKATVEWDVVRYADAGHGFNCDQRPSYHEASARDAWSRALGWFGSHLP